MEPACRSNHILQAMARFTLCCNTLEPYMTYFWLLKGFFFDFSSGFQVHNGYLAESKRVTNLGKTYQQLTIATSMGKKIIVRRYYGTGGKELKHFATRSRD